MKTNSQKAFTIIELLITVTIAGILMAIAMPSFKNMVSGDRLNSYRNLLYTDIILARSKAVESNGKVFICASSDGSTCGGNFKDGWIILQDTDSDETATAADTVIKIQQAIDGDIKFQLDTATLSTITIDGRGFTPDSSGVISVCDDRGNDFAKTLSISKTGRPSRRGAAPSC